MYPLPSMSQPKRESRSSANDTFLDLHYPGGLTTRAYRVAGVLLLVGGSGH
jgi:hypothetical protein